MRARIRSALAPSLCALALSAASAPAQPPGFVTPPDSLLTVVYAPALRVDLAHSRRLQGVYVRDLRTGRGDTVRTFATLTLRLRMRLPDGSAVGADTAVQVQRWLPGTYLHGIEVGLRGMRAGGRRQLVLPAALAYGEHAPPGVPPGAPLVVDVELLHVG